MAYPLPGFGQPNEVGRNPFLDDLNEQQAQQLPPSKLSRSRSTGKLSHDPSPTKQRPQTARQAAVSNAERIVRDPRLWHDFRAMIREERNSVALPTTNLLTIEYLHKFVERQFEVEAERSAQENLVYREIQRRYESADSSSKTDKDFGDGRMLHKAAKWLTESFSSLSLNNAEREEEAAALATAYDAQRASQKQSSALAMSRRTTMNMSSSSTMNMSSSSTMSMSSSSTMNMSSSSTMSTSSRSIDSDAQSSEVEEPSTNSPINSHDNSSCIPQQRPCQQDEQEHNSHQVHYHSSPRLPLPPQGPPPSTPVVPRSSGLGGLPASRGVPLPGILEYGEPDYDHNGPGDDDPTARGRCPVPDPSRLPPASCHERTASWGPRAA